jgi:hypothetical protein
LLVAGTARETAGVSRPKELRRSSLLIQNPVIASG